MSDRKQLGQARPADTNNATLYSPSDYTKAQNIRVLICNTSGADSTFRLFHDKDGTTFTEATALYWDVPIAADQTIPLDLEFDMSDPDGAIGVRSGNADALTFTAYGEETEEQTQ